jgi:hypothetical protein
MRIGELYFPGIRKGFFELRLGFSGESNDEIGAQTGGRIPGAKGGQPLNHPIELCAGTIHAAQYSDRKTLKADMEVITQFTPFPDHRTKPIRNFLSIN